MNKKLINDPQFINTFINLHKNVKEHRTKQQVLKKKKTICGVYTLIKRINVKILFITQ
jgi:hypothetical protein